MRTLLTGLTVLVATGLLAPVVILGRLLRRPEGPDSVYQKVMTMWAHAMCVAAGVTVKVHGAERMSRDAGVIYAANHVSWFDIFALASVLPRYSFVAKSELRKLPLFGWGAESAGIIFLERENRKAAFESYKVAARQVRSGRSVVVCPEGTRGRDYHLRPFKKGPFVLAIAAQAPIVPTLVYGAREVMPKGSFRIRPGVVEIHLLEPVPSAGYDYEHRSELMSVVWHRMADAMRDLYGVGTNEFPVAGGLEQSA